MHQCGYALANNIVVWVSVCVEGLATLVDMPREPAYPPDTPMENADGSLSVTFVNQYGKDVELFWEGYGWPCSMCPSLCQTFFFFFFC